MDAAGTWTRLEKTDTQRTPASLFFMPQPDPADDAAGPLEIEWYPDDDAPAPGDNAPAGDDDSAPADNDAAHADDSAAGPDAVGCSGDHSAAASLDCQVPSVL